MDSVCDIVSSKSVEPYGSPRSDVRALRVLTFYSAFLHVLHSVLLSLVVKKLFFIRVHLRPTNWWASALISLRDPFGTRQNWLLFLYLCFYNLCFFNGSDKSAPYNTRNL